MSTWMKQILLTLPLLAAAKLYSIISIEAGIARVRGTGRGSSQSLGDREIRTATVCCGSCIGLVLVCVARRARAPAHLVVSGTENAREARGRSSRRSGLSIRAHVARVHTRHRLVLADRARGTRTTTIRVAGLSHTVAVRGRTRRQCR